MSDLVERLEAGVTTEFGCHHPIWSDIVKADATMAEAAAEITRLQKELEAAREDALEEADRSLSLALSEGSKIPSGAVPYINGIRQAIRALKDKEVAG